MNLDITDRAVVKALEHIVEYKKNCPGEFALRVQVKGGGCAGFLYEFLVDVKRAEDVVFRKEVEGRGILEVIVDVRSAAYINGAIVDHQGAVSSAGLLQQEGYVLRLPNAKGSCGCGKSFDV